MLRPRRAALPPWVWLRRLFVAILGLNIALIGAGVAVVPATLSSPLGLATLLADVAMQSVLATLALAGPWSFRRVRASIGISGALGLVFAALYLGIILLEFAGVNDNLNILALFVLVAGVAGAVASYRTRRWQSGPLAAIWALVIGTGLWSAGILLINYVSWGSHQQYVFWLNDGAIDAFWRSGSRDLNVFLLQDVQGALFFHPLLSMVVGAIGGMIGGSVARGSIGLHRWVVERERSEG